MYLAVDIGGTKTLLAAFNDEGQQVSHFKFPTPENYDEFLKQLAENLPKLGEHDFRAATVAVPGKLDRPHGRVIALGNLPWRNEDIDADLERITHCPVEIENDAKLAGLSEALILKGEFKRALYLTFSTGIGIALINDGVIDTNVGDIGGDGMLLEHNGKLMPWEDFAAGKAIVEKYGKRASEIDDPNIWRNIVKDMAVGMIDLIAVLQPEVIIIGGGVGANFIKFGDLLIERLKTYETPMMSIPPIRPAVRAEEAVVYGCFELARARNNG
ncbi:MAG: ROK family protein [Candidatus Saccharibacteria bacterium]|nr:ROK family protein [Candidatus Saccharibacteria bacterium]